MRSFASFDIGAAIVLISILVSSAFRKSNHNRASLALLLTVSESLLTALFHVAVIVLENSGPGYSLLKWITHSFYELLHMLAPVFYFSFLITLTESWHRTLKKIFPVCCLFLPPLAFFFLILTNPAHKLIFSVENGVTVFGPYARIGYLLGLVSLIYGIILVIRSRKLFSKSDFFLLLLFNPFIGLFRYIQSFFPGVTMELFGNAVMLLVIWMNIQRPEDLIDPQTHFGNRTTYLSLCKKSFLSEKPFRILRFEICEFTNITNAIGLAPTDELVEIVSRKIRSADRIAKTKADICYVGWGVFFLLVNSSRYPESDRCATMLTRALNFDFVSDGLETAIHSYCCIYNVPDDLPVFERINDLGNLFIEPVSLPKDTVLYASDLFTEDRYRLLIDINAIIERALQNDLFEVYYQPVWSVAEQRFISAEALLRLRDPGYGFISPEVIVKAAENNGTIYRIGEIVLKKVCAFIADCEFEQLGLDFIQINLSPKECIQDNLAGKILTTISLSGVAPKRINLEITETSMALSTNIVKVLKELRAAGIGISLDDFGSGYSNIKRISTLPIDIVKLDRAFTEIAESDRSNAVISDLIHLIKHYNVDVLIEGVETHSMSEIFSGLGCDFIQGYLYAKPMPPEKLKAFLLKSPNDRPVS